MFPLSDLTRSLGVRHKGARRVTSVAWWCAWIASSDDRGRIFIHDAIQGEHIATLRGHDKEVNAIEFSKDGSILASGSDDRIVILWRCETFLERVSVGDHLRGHMLGISCVSVNPGSSVCASGCKDGCMRLWSTSSLQRLGNTLFHGSGNPIT